MGDFEIHNSPRAGGRYKISGTAKAVMASKDIFYKAKITTWLVNKRLTGELVPEINSVILDTGFDRQLAMTVDERVRKFFLAIEFQNYRLGARFLELSYSPEPNPMGDHDEWFSDLDEKMYFEAFTECIEEYDLNRLLDYLEEKKVIRKSYDGYGDGNYYKLTSEGIEKLELSHANFGSKLAFVAMWFDPNDKTIFENGIKPAIEFDPYGKPTGFRAFRVDQEHHADFIMDFMIGNIKRSRFMVADFTSFMVKGHRVMDGQTLSAEALDYQIGRGGVYYEAGYAMGLGIPVIATCRKSQTEHIHFDLKQFNTIYWEDVADLKEQLSNRIFSMFVT